MLYKTLLKKPLTYVVIFVFLLGCATVPKDVVRLSSQVGEDIQSLQESYDQLIHEYYEMLRNERVTYLDNEWYPRFLENWMETGELTAIATGEKIWSEEKQMLIPRPPDADEKETLQTLQDWLNYALYAYETKQENLTASLDEDEAELRRDVNMAFHQITRANAAITAHLNSVREVKEVQDETMEALGIKELREKINSKLIAVSKKAEQQLEEIRKADQKVDNLVEQLN